MLKREFNNINFRSSKNSEWVVYIQFFKPLYIKCESKSSENFDSHAFKFNCNLSKSTTIAPDPMKTGNVFLNFPENCRKQLFRNPIPSTVPSPPATPIFAKWSCVANFSGFSFRIQSIFKEEKDIGERLFGHDDVSAFHRILLMLSTGHPLLKIVFQLQRCFKSYPLKICWHCNNIFL